MKAKKLLMTATTNTGATFKTIVILEAGDDEAGALGQVQGDFLASLFTFTTEDQGELELQAGAPVNYHEDVVQVK